MNSHINKDWPEYKAEKVGVSGAKRNPRVYGKANVFYWGIWQRRMQRSAGPAVIRTLRDAGITLREFRRGQVDHGVR